MIGAVELGAPARAVCAQLYSISSD